eukprot:PhF_6_TR11253/c0_g1_i2/m.18153/K22132/tcdA; tRNA threonylcarbamoyladenosine dehydratase
MALNGGIYERTQVLVGDDGMRALANAAVLVVGLGGVGGYAAESLCRAGIGTITIADHDVVSVSNKNRQLLATDSTVGEGKVAVMKRRMMDINSACKVYAVEGFLLPQDMPRLVLNTLVADRRYDYVVDCIDSIECKAALLETCSTNGIKVVTSGGAGGRMDPLKIVITDICEVNGDALMSRMRHEVKFPRGTVQCVWSTEEPKKPLPPERQESGEGRPRSINGTISYMPCLYGNIMASVVIRNFASNK